MAEPQMVDPHDVVMTGENSFLRLSGDGGKTFVHRTSHWRVLWSPAGQGHALFIESPLLGGSPRPAEVTGREPAMGDGHQRVLVPVGEALARVCEAVSVLGAERVSLGLRHPGHVSERHDLAVDGDALDRVGRGRLQLGRDALAAPRQRVRLDRDRLVVLLRGGAQFAEPADGVGAGGEALGLASVLNCAVSRVGQVP